MKYWLAGWLAGWLSVNSVVFRHIYVMLCQKILLTSLRFIDLFPTKHDQIQDCVEIESGALYVMEETTVEQLSMQS